MSMFFQEEVQPEHGQDEAVEVVASIGTGASGDKIDGQSGTPKNISFNDASMVDLLKPSADENQNKHNRRKVGCKCKKAACLVKFCECVQLRTHCGPLCKCFNCGYQPKQYAT